MSRTYLLLAGLLGGMLLFGCSDGETDTGTGAVGGAGGTGGSAGSGGGGSGGAGGGDPSCTGLIDLAVWDFNGSSLAPSMVATNVIAENFTSKDGQPTTLNSGGVELCTESGWTLPMDDPNLNYLEGSIRPATGFEIRLENIEFEQATLSRSVGPTTWNIRSSLDGFAADIPGGQGLTSELPQLTTTLVDLNSFPVQSGDITFHWHGFGATNANTEWGVDNVIIHGSVCSQ